MAVRIRLTRVGATKRPAYRVIAIDGRRPRDGRALEILGFYDPLTEPATVQLQSERISAWIGKGAQPSDTVVRLMRQAEAAAASPTTEAPKRPARPKAKPRPAAAAAAEPAVAEPAETSAPAEAESPGEGQAAGRESAAAETAPDETPAHAPGEGAEPPSTENADGEPPAAAGRDSEREA